jgi:hypothetical protein
MAAARDPRPEIKRMSLKQLQDALLAESGTPLRSSDRVRRFLLWRRLDRIIRWRDRKSAAPPVRQTE